jgi:hypothetical protein
MRFLAVVVAATAPFVLLLASGGLVEARYGHDLFHLLDAAHRIRLGQVPHRDFYLPYGALEPTILALVHGALARSPLALHIARALIGVPVALTAFGLARRRMSEPLALFYSAVVIATMAGQHQLSFPIQDLSHSAGYNRIGYALLALVLAEALPLAAGVSSSPRTTIVEAAVSGFALGLCLFVKPTLPFIGALMVAFSFGLGPERPRRLTTIVAGALVAVVTGGGGLVRFAFGAMLGDYMFAADARSSSIRSTVSGDIVLDMAHRTSVDLTIGRVLETIVNEAPLVAIIVVLGALATGRPGARFLGSRRDAVLLAVAFSGLSLVTVLTSWQWGESALLPMLAIAFGSLAMSSEHARLARVLAIVATVPFLAKALASVAYACAFPALHAEYLRPPHAFSEPSTRGLMMVGSDSACRRSDYVTRIEGGVAKLRELGLAHSNVLVLDFSNPFPYLLDAPPPRGAGVVWHAHSTVSETTFLPPDRMFADADAVLIPQCAEDPFAVNLLMAHYSAYLTAMYREIGKDSNFVFLVRKSS